MKAIIRFSPRRTGKSTLAHYEFMKDPKNTCFMVYNEAMKGDMISRFLDLKEYDSNIFTQKQPLRGRRFKRCIIDEFLLFENKYAKDVYINLPFTDVEEVLVFTTRDVLRSNSELINFVKDLKLKGLTLDSDEVGAFVHVNQDKYMSNSSLRDALSFIYYSWISDTETRIIFDNHKYSTTANFLKPIE